ncbi:hypothetical protein B566_EDAN018488, partial [Ephemera danica]
WASAAAFCAFAASIWAWAHSPWRRRVLSCWCSTCSCISTTVVRLSGDGLVDGFLGFCMRGACGGAGGGGKSEFDLIVASELTAVQFLQDRALFPSDVNPPSCYACGGETKQSARLGRPKQDGTQTHEISFRCRKKDCRKQRCIRKFNNFFGYESQNGRSTNMLTICNILRLIWWWCSDTPQASVLDFSGHSSRTVVDWYNLCRDVCVGMWQRREKMGGPGKILQIDECLLRGKRKYNRGRLLLGDNRARNDERDELEPDEEEFVGEIDSNRNHGDRIDGPWIFGLCDRREDGKVDRRFHHVQRRDRATLLPIVETEVHRDTTIHSDEWPAYATLGQHGFVHESVNHSENFVDPETGANTQRIERMWVGLKFTILRSMHGTTMQLLPRYLAEAWWKGLNPRADRFECFLRDVAITF